MFILQYRHTYRQKDILLLYIRVLQGSIPPNVSLIGSAINEGQCNKNTHIIQYVIKIQKSLFLEKMAVRNFFFIHFVFQKNIFQKLYFLEKMAVRNFFFILFVFQKNIFQKLYFLEKMAVRNFFIAHFVFQKNIFQKLYFLEKMAVRKFFIVHFVFQKNIFQK